MMLKKLDIAGFKSFAGKVSIDFMPGVTAVVGPNGSGKSNITEAIRWVLGEQSAKNLRGGKMEDVIFSGSESRRRLNEADVTIILDNSDGSLPLDYSEVSITRRVNRKGDSWFFINKQSCRLKDIVELFMDSGLGRQSFSIIGQGRVDEILNSRPEERRAIFEEAAGVLKYKTRKKQAETKLAETEVNISRVTDILYELEQRVEPLAIQAAAAKDYVEKKAALKELEAALWTEEITAATTKLADYEQKRQREEEQAAAIEQKAVRQQEAIQAIEQNMQQLAETEADMQSQLVEAAAALEKAEGQRRVMEERTRHAALSGERITAALQEAERACQKAEKQAAEAAAVYQEKAQQVTAMREQEAALQQELEPLSGDSKAALDALKAAYIDQLSREAALKNEQIELARQLDRLQARFERIGSTNDPLLQERAVLEAQHAGIQQSAKEAEQAWATHTASYEQAKKDREAAHHKLDRKRTALYKAYQLLQEAVSRRDMLLALEADYAGFFSGVKEVLKEKNGRLTGVIGAAADVIRVPAAYETAIETALAGALQHILVTDEAAARRAISFLKQQKAGRATFLPLSTIKPKSVPAAVQSAAAEVKGFLGTADGLVEADKAYGAAVAHLLGHVLVAASLEDANAIARKTSYRYRVVTTKGDVVNTGGSMTGGSLKKSGPSLLGRKQELDELQSRIASMNQKIKQAEQDVKDGQRRTAELDQRIAALEKQGEQYRQLRQKAKDAEREWSFQQQALRDRLALYDAEQREYKEEQLRLKHRQAAALQALQELQAQSAETKADIAALESDQQSADAKKEAVTADLHAVQSRYAVAKEQLQHASEQKQRAQAERQAAEEQLTRLQNERSLLEEEQSNHDVRIDELAQKATQEALRKSGLTKQIQQLKEDRAALATSLAEEKETEAESRRLLKGLSDALRSYDAAMARLEAEINATQQKLEEQYGLSVEEAIEAYALDQPVEEAKKAVRLIKRSIEELGDVNIGAIEEYESVFERVSFLRDQKADLDEAKQTLRSVMDEMDEEMVRRFSETFEAIQQSFQPAFAKLFGGGRAELRLTDPKDVLNSGVEIAAMPPGKKLQQLSLLSGGERALTAIALLFAILHVRPVPFCILDEVEAALDEANVHRFSRYLKEFSADTQFIVITHRKQTMEEADALYGVSMQESGITSLVSVRLEAAAVQP